MGSAEERGILDDSERSKRLQNVYSARDNSELASTYDEWAEDYEDDMLSLGYAIPAVTAGFVGRHVPLGGTVVDAGAGTGSRVVLVLGGLCTHSRELRAGWFNRSVDYRPKV
jgi:hypothetical protein